MCGIAGLIDCSRPVAASVIKRMTDVVQHRGPDDEGFATWGRFQECERLPTGKLVCADTSSGQITSVLSRGGVAFGHRRLSILDLTAAGHQPMCSADGRYWIVFNGEIYNFKELRPELERAGYEFRSNCDTEVALAAYAHWGEECLHRFNGMWGLAIYDTWLRTLFASRDRFGVKPFYYAVSGERFGFGSEVKQLLTAGFGTGKADQFRVAQFLLYKTVSWTPDTFFEGIQQLPASYALRWRLDDGVKGIETFRYYDPPCNFSMRPNAPLEDYRREFATIFEDAVKLRLRSDVPVGTCLSGGLDSSSIVLTVSRLLKSSNGNANGNGHPQKTFTSCFQDARFDEWRFAESVAKVSQVDARRVFPDMDRLWDEMDDLIWHQEEPLTSTSAYAQWNVMRLARDSGVTVLLDGQGADEVMGGYHYFLPDYLLSTTREVSVWKTLESLKDLRKTGLMSAAQSSFRGSLWALMGSLLRRAGGLNAMPASLWSSMLPQFQLPNQDTRPRPFQEHLRWCVYRGLQSLLRFEDRNSMAFSIEARTPFLDYRLVELFLGMCGSYKIRDGWTKPFIREAFKGAMPEDVRLRVDKKGFVTPEELWYRKHFNKIRYLLVESESPIHTWVNPRQLGAWLDGASFSDFTICRLLTLHFWMKRFSLT